MATFQKVKAKIDMQAKCNEVSLYLVGKQQKTFYFGEKDQCGSSYTIFNLKIFNSFQSENFNYN